MREIVIGTAVLLLVEQTCGAAEFKAINSNDGKTRIDLVGEIVEGDTASLGVLIAKANAANRVVATIRLNSIGGNLGEGVAIADIVRKGRISTSVLSNSTCASACFVVFAAGYERFAHYEARIGVHGASDSSGKETANATAATVGMARIVRDLGVPPAIIGKMVVTPPDQMVWLSVDDLKSMETKMFGKPSQLSPPPQTQLPLPISPGVQANVAKKPPEWKEIVDIASARSASQNGGRPQFSRTCQPELKVCVMGISYKLDGGKEGFIRVTENVSGDVISREICTLNSFSDIRDCFNWDTGKKRRDMKNRAGEWYAVSEE